MIPKDPELFPIKKRYIYLAHCSVSPLYRGAFKKEEDLARGQMEEGILAMRGYVRVLDELREAAAALLRTAPRNLAMVKNTSEGMGLIANGYPFRAGDQVICYVHEYPANYYPWKLQESRGVEVVLLPDRDLAGRANDGAPCRWLMRDLESAVSRRTRIVALSHVQFASGFAADLPQLGKFCRDRGIDLVVDAAQSLGCLPVFPEEYGIAAVAASGWKWLLGPVGTGLLYTSEELREKLGPVMTGAELMCQGQDYLNHAWQPHTSAKRFEYSTSPVSLAAALTAAIVELPLRLGIETIRAEVFRLQDILAAGLARERFAPLVFAPPNRSGILSVACRDDPEQLMQALAAEGLICAARGGYLRLAPHFYNDEAEMQRAVSLLNGI